MGNRGTLTSYLRAKALIASLAVLVFAVVFPCPFMARPHKASQGLWTSRYSAVRQAVRQSPPDISQTASATQPAGL